MASVTASRERLAAVCRGAACAVVPHPANAYRPYLFRHPVLGFVNALILCATVGASLLISLTPEVARLSTVTVSTLVRFTNAERSKAGLPPLTEHPVLTRSAQLKGEHMLRHDYFDHTSPDGLSPWAWFNLARYAYLYAGENLAIDFSEAEDVVAAWMRSPGHRRNLLSDRYDDIGIAVVTGEFEGRTVTMVVQHFGRRPASGGAANRSASAPLLVASENRTRGTPVRLAVPQILEPREGQTVSTSAATVRGFAPLESRVQLSVDGAVVGTFESAEGSFRGTVSVPENQERTAVLRARAIKDGQTSAWSVPRTVRVDTKGPDIAITRAALLPDPQRGLGRALLVVPAGGDVRSLAVLLPNHAAIPLERDGEVLSVRLAVPLQGPLHLRATDAHGNTHTVQWHPFLSYTTAESPTRSTRLQLAAAASDLRSWLSGFLLVFAALFVVNLFFHLRFHRLLHADLVGHALLVVSLGSAVVFLT
ncbi:MAG: hypothetical protein G01um101438_966 [Parcubacteria group bacterium Gr01-1014_38]|nr:MAG: hypothetical protein G01um101438_966 [Parcubacteria group bacterium Gr01-1014_38]